MLKLNSPYTKLSPRYTVIDSAGGNKFNLIHIEKKLIGHLDNMKKIRLQIYEDDCCDTLCINVENTEEYREYHNNILCELKINLDVFYR